MESNSRLIKYEDLPNMGKIKTIEHIQKADSVLISDPIFMQSESAKTFIWHVLNICSIKGFTAKWMPDFEKGTMTLTFE